jgi:hypothetical protein
LNRLGSLLLAFCGLFFFYLIMKPRTETLLGRVLSSWGKAFLVSLFQALLISVILFGALGVFAVAGMSLIPRYPIWFVVISGIATVLFLRANTATNELSSDFY